MNRLLLSLLLMCASLLFLATPVEAKRLGGGGTSGLKRMAPAPQPAQPVPAKPAVTPAPVSPGVAPAAAPRRSWLGPIAGLAAGLGLAALMSHLGLGAEFGNLLAMLLLGVVAFVGVRFLVARFRPAPAAATMAYAGAGSAAGASAAASLPTRNEPAAAAIPSRMDGPAIEPAFAPTRPAPISALAHALPPGFDSPAFERLAKLIFIRMQAANDAGDLNDLRQFATPEMYASFRLELQDRPAGPQTTDVVQLAAEVVDFEQDAERQIVSVRFHGLIREGRDAPVERFDETWHLVRPVDGSRDWAIAGIAQNAVA